MMNIYCHITIMNMSKVSHNSSPFNKLIKRKIYNILIRTKKTQTFFVKEHRNGIIKNW